MKLYHRSIFPNGNLVVLLESDCQNWKTQLTTWIRDDTGMGYGDWKNYLEFNSYDGKRRGGRKSLEPKVEYGPCILERLSEDSVAFPFQNEGHGLTGVTAESGNCFLFALSTLVGVVNVIKAAHFDRYFRQHSQTTLIRYLDLSMQRYYASPG